MTKRIASLAVIGAAAATFALPAAPASAACSWTFPKECVNELVSVAQFCHRAGTFVYVCVPPS